MAYKDREVYLAYQKQYNQRPERKEAIERYRQEHRKQVQRTHWELNYLAKVDAMLHYGNGGIVCNHCGNTNIDVLCIDHINGCGSMHRHSSNRAGLGLYRWLKKNNYPEGFQILCWNCNHEKEIRTRGI
ncbi:unnamed protein product [marine sediment metagenome]|uniref:HNH domain-containing protein n=1 Tax=marine sediment metagenome TaxID=412755 RepID=X1DGA5_9ZZZZ